MLTCTDLHICAHTREAIQLVRRLEAKFSPSNFARLRVPSVVLATVIVLSSIRVEVDVVLLLRPSGVAVVFYISLAVRCVPCASE
jgi:hypothetical protein